MRRLHGGRATTDEDSTIATAVFILGGSASGKSSVVVRDYIGTQTVPGAETSIPPQPGFRPQRWFDADRIKRLIPLYTNREGDESAVAKFGVGDLGGPSGPRTEAEYALYPDDVRLEFEAFLLEETGFATVADFADAVLDEREPGCLGGGLTHELSKFMAQAQLEGALTDDEPKENLIWDACGRPDSYLRWIDMALSGGFDVEIVYVYCPLAVAKARAAVRERLLDPAIVEETFRRAAETAEVMEVEAADRRAEGYEIRYRSVKTSTAAEEALVE